MHTMVSPQGQSMNDLTQQRLQQQMQQMQQQQMQQQQSGYGQQPLQPQQTGYGIQNGFNQFQNGMMPQQTGFGQQFPQQLQPQQTGYGGFQQQQPTGFQPSMQQQFVNGQQTGSPFADPPRQPLMPQPTGMQQSYSPSPLQPQQTGLNTFLPPALQPQRTGFGGGGPQQGFGNQGGYGNQGFGQSPPPMPPMPQQQQQMAAPLMPQKTGPPPPVRFGVSGAAKRLEAQPTGRKANLAAASKCCLLCLFFGCPSSIAQQCVFFYGLLANVALQLRRILLASEVLCFGGRSRRFGKGWEEGVCMYVYTKIFQTLCCFSFSCV